MTSGPGLRAELAGIMHRSAASPLTRCVISIGYMVARDRNFSDDRASFRRTPKRVGKLL